MRRSAHRVGSSRRGEGVSSGQTVDTARRLGNERCSTRWTTGLDAWIPGHRSVAGREATREKAQGEKYAFAQGKQKARGDAVKAKGWRMGRKWVKTVLLVRA